MEQFALLRAKIKNNGNEFFIRTITIIALTLLLLIALGGISHNERWRITEIKVLGAASVSEDTIRTVTQQKLQGNYFFVYARDNSFLFSEKEIEQELLNALPPLKTVIATRTDMNALTIEVSERKPYVLWCGEEFHGETPDLSLCWFTDNTGFIFDRAPTFSEGVYTEVYGVVEKKNTDTPLGSTLPVSRFKNADNLAQALGVEIAEPLRIIFKPDDEFEITMKGNATYSMLANTKLLFKDTALPSTIVKNLRSAIQKEFPDGALLKKKLLYIDMRFGNKIFFGFAN